MNMERVSSRVLWATLAGGLLACCQVAPTLAGWEVVYETDFSTDPGWMTNNSANYYWEPSTGTFFSRQIDGLPDEYAYIQLPLLQAGYRWRVEYDVYPISYTWAGDARLGLMDPGMDIACGTSQHLHLDFPLVDQGHTTYLAYQDSKGVASRHFGFFTPGTWYSAVMEWDPQGGTLYANVRERDSGNLVADTMFSGLAGFSGIDRLAMSTVCDHYAPGATGEARTVVMPARRRIPFRRGE